VTRYVRGAAVLSRDDELDRQRKAGNKAGLSPPPARAGVVRRFCVPERGPRTYWGGIEGCGVCVIVLLEREVLRLIRIG